MCRFWSQGIFSSIFLLLAELGESLRAAYQIMVDMTVIVTLIPFVYIFASGMKFGQRWAGATGAIVSAIAIVLSTIPPPGVASVWLFELKVVGGTLLLVLAGRADLRPQSGLSPDDLPGIRPVSLLARKRDSDREIRLGSDHAFARSSGQPASRWPLRARRRDQWEGLHLRHDRGRIARRRASALASIPRRT